MKLVLNRSFVIDSLLSIFIFAILIDPTDSLFRLKIPLFVLVLFACVLSYKRVWSESIKVVISLYGILLITTVIGILCGYNTDCDMQLFYYKTFLMIFLLPWCPYLCLLERLLLPGIFISLVVIACYVISLLNSETLISIANYTYLHLDGILSVGYRKFLGIEIVSVFYSTSVVFLILFPIICCKYLTRRNNRSFVLCLLMFFLFIASGLRAIMMSGFAILFFSWVLYVWDHGRKRNALLFTFLGMVIGIMLASLLLSDKGEVSLDTKTALVKAFWHHIFEYPETLLWGNGVGATFDSLGVRGSEATQSELFYYEIVRFWGVPLGFAFLMIYLYPMVLIYRNRCELCYWKYILLGYTFYLLSAGTNPYLTSSNGLLTLLLMYSYALNPYYRHEYTNNNRTVQMQIK